MRWTHPALDCDDTRGDDGLRGPRGVDADRALVRMREPAVRHARRDREAVARAQLEALAAGLDDAAAAQHEAQLRLAMEVRLQQRRGRLGERYRDGDVTPRRRRHGQR